MYRQTRPTGVGGLDAYARQRRRPGRRRGVGGHAPAHESLRGAPLSRHELVERAEVAVLMLPTRMSVRWRSEHFEDPFDAEERYE